MKVSAAILRDENSNPVLKLTVMGNGHDKNFRHCSGKRLFCTTPFIEPLL